MSHQHSPESNPEATGSSEGADYLQLYFGQSGPPRTAYPLDFGVPGGPGDGLELGSELASMLFPREEEMARADGCDRAGCARNSTGLPSAGFRPDATQMSHHPPGYYPNPISIFSCCSQEPSPDGVSQQARAPFGDAGSAGGGGGGDQASHPLLVSQPGRRACLGLDDVGEGHLRLAPNTASGSASGNSTYQLPQLDDRFDGLSCNSKAAIRSLPSAAATPPSSLAGQHAHQLLRFSQPASSQASNPFLSPGQPVTSSVDSFFLVDQPDPDPYPYPYPHPPRQFSHHPPGLPPMSTGSERIHATLTLDSHPLDLAQFWSSLTPSLADPFGQPVQPEPAEHHPERAGEQDQGPELEFGHLVVEEQCAPSTLPSPPLSSSSSSSNEHNPSAAGPSLALALSPTAFRPKKQPDQLSHPYPHPSPTGLFLQTEQSPAFYPLQPIAHLNQLAELKDSFSDLINFDLSSPPPSARHHSFSSSSALNIASTSASFLTSAALSPLPSAALSPRSATAVDLPIGHGAQLSPNLDLPPGPSFEPSIGSTSSLPSPTNFSYPSAMTPQSTLPEHLSIPAASVRPQVPPHFAHYHPGHSFQNASRPFSTLAKQAPSAAEVPTEAELAVPRLIRLEQLEPYPSNLALLLVGLQAEGAKTRVETQIKLTLILVAGEGASVNQSGNLVAEPNANLARVGNWTHIKLPAYSAIKRKSKKLIKTGIPPQETLLLEVAAVRASEPYDEIYCCSNCQIREQKRTQRKRDARVRPAQEIESDEAEQAIMPEDEKRKIVVFNCGQYVGFESGEVTLPTRITCYCRHHREKKGFRVKISLRDHRDRLIASSITPAIMITDDHKAVAAAAKAKSGSDADESQPRPRPIRRLPSMTAPAIQSAANRAKKRQFSGPQNMTPEPQIKAVSSDDSGRCGFNTCLGGGRTGEPTCLQPPLQAQVRTALTKAKRKAPNDLDQRINIGRRTASNHTAISNRETVAPTKLISNQPSSRKTKASGHKSQSTQLIAMSPSLADCRVNSNTQPHTRLYDRCVSTPMPLAPPHLRSSQPCYQGEPDESLPFQEDSSRLPPLPCTFPEVKPALTIDMEMKDELCSAKVSNSALSEHIDHNLTSSHVTSLPPSDADSSIHQTSNHPNIHSYGTPIFPAGQRSHCPELSCQDVRHQADQTFQNYQSTSGPELSCSTSSSPDQMRVHPFSSCVDSPPPSQSPDTSPNSSVNSNQANRPDLSGPNSRSSSIVCSRTRESGDSSSGCSEENQTLREPPIQPSNPPSAPDSHPKNPPSVSRTSPSVSRTFSPVNTSPRGMLGSVLTNWNVLSNFLPLSPASAARSSPNLSGEVIPPRPQDSANIPPLLHMNARPESGAESGRAPAQIRKLVPNEGPIEGGIEITILGEGFHPQLKADFGTGAVVRTEFWSSNTLVCVLPPSARAGPCEVTLIEEEGAEGQQGHGQVFTYVNQADQRLMELALQVVGLKMTGQIQDAKSLARKIIVETKGLEGLAAFGEPMGASGDQGLEEVESIILKVLAAAMGDNEGQEEGEGARTISLASSKTGHTLLHLSVILGFKRLVRHLVERKISLNALDANAFTALHFSCLIGQDAEMVRLLLEAGARTYIRNLIGEQTALDLLRHQHAIQQMSKERLEELLRIFEARKASRRWTEKKGDSGDESGEDSVQKDDQLDDCPVNSLSLKPSGGHLAADGLAAKLAGREADGTVARSLAGVSQKKKDPKKLSTRVQQVSCWPNTVDNRYAQGRAMYEHDPRRSAVAKTEFIPIYALGTEASMRREETEKERAKRMRSKKNKRVEYRQMGERSAERQAMKKRISKRLGFLPVLGDEDVMVEAYQYHDQKRRTLKKDKMLYLFWIPILVVGIAYGVLTMMVKISIRRGWLGWGMKGMVIET